MGVLVARGDEGCPGAHEDCEAGEDTLDTACIQLRITAVGLTLALSGCGFSNVQEQAQDDRPAGRVATEDDARRVNFGEKVLVACYCLV